MPAPAFAHRRQLKEKYTQICHFKEKYTQICHSRAGGNPFEKSTKSTKKAFLQAQKWIPACAGMTDLFFLKLTPMRLRWHDRHVGHYKKAY